MSTVILVVALVSLVGMAVAAYVVVSLAKKAAARALDVASNVATQAMSRAVDLGAQQLVQTVKTASEEAKRRDPAWVEVQINGLAHRRKGELTLANVISELQVASDLATSVLADLVARKVCFAREDVAGAVTVFVFPGFKERREVKACEYCNAVYMPEDVKDTCTQCGATLKRTTTLA